MNIDRIMRRVGSDSSRLPFHPAGPVNVSSSSSVMRGITKYHKNDENCQFGPEFVSIRIHGTDLAFHKQTQVA